MKDVDLVAYDVYLYWVEKTKTTLRSVKVKNAALNRIRLRLDDGFGPDELKRCVDFAMVDEFYQQHGYHKQPDVIFRNSERVQSLLARVNAIREERMKNLWR
jgi:hypothetical protein